MIQTLKYIIDVYGLDILKDGNKLLAYYSDLSPKQQRERQMLEYLVKCNGHVILLNALYDTTDEQMRKMKLLVERMVAQVLVSDDIAKITCQNFWEAIGGTPIVLKQPKPVPTSHNPKNLQEDEGENATHLRKRVLQAIDEGPTIESIVDRGFMSLEDGAYDEAKKHFDCVLNVHPQCADAYLGLFMAEIKARNKSQAGKIFADGDLTGNRFYQRAKQFADTSLKVELESWEKQRNNRLIREAEEREEARKAKEAAEEARQTRILELRTIRSKYDQCRFVISAGDWHTVGLKADGTVVATVITLRDNDIIKPDFGLKTKDMFQKFDQSFPVYKVLDELCIGWNDFEIVAPLEIQTYKERLINNGAFTANMSGSGSAVIGYFHDTKSQLRTYKLLRKFFEIYPVMACDGVEILNKKSLC